MAIGRAARNQLAAELGDTFDQRMLDHRAFPIERVVGEQGFGLDTSMQV
jgi:hypothetical protein